MTIFELLDLKPDSGKLVVELAYQARKEELQTMKSSLKEALLEELEQCYSEYQSSLSENQLDVVEASSISPDSLKDFGRSWRDLIDNYYLGGKWVKEMHKLSPSDIKVIEEKMKEYEEEIREEQRLQREAEIRMEKERQRQRVAEAYRTKTPLPEWPFWQRVWFRYEVLPLPVRILLQAVYWICRVILGIVYIPVLFVSFLLYLGGNIAIALGGLISWICAALMIFGLIHSYIYTPHIWWNMSHPLWERLFFNAFMWLWAIGMIVLPIVAFFFLGGFLFLVVKGATWIYGETLTDLVGLEDWI